MSSIASTADPYLPVEEKGKKIKVADWLNLMGKTRHITKPENKAILEAAEKEIARRFARLKAMHASDIL